MVLGRVDFHTITKQTLQLRPQLLEDCSKYGVTVQAVDSIWNAGEEVPVQERMSSGIKANQARCKLNWGFFDSENDHDDDDDADADDDGHGGGDVGDGDDVGDDEVVMMMMMMMMMSVMMIMSVMMMVMMMIMMVLMRKGGWLKDF